MDLGMNRQWRLARRPEGLAQPADFQWGETPVPRPGPDQALVRHKLLSLDPTNRSWMAERGTYMPPIPLGDVMRGLGVGVVVESNNAALPAGSPVYGAFGWQDYAVVGPQDLVVPLPNDPGIPLTMHLGLFGHIGMTAYFGLIDVAKPQRGETLVVSGAAGAVGSLAGQIGKILGCRVVGMTGAADKCQWLVDELGFDAAINYRQESSLGAALRRHCADGIDVYFDNVGGHVLEAALGLINLRARVALCGMISTYNEGTTPGQAPAGPRNLFEVIVKRARMEGFLVLDFWNRASEAVEALARWHGEGRLKYRTHVVEGLEQAPAALNMLFDGTNRGKLIVRL
jgi:NADPH-dependent curcumin reductase CurA